MKSRSRFLSSRLRSPSQRTVTEQQHEASTTP
ncbi:uncharacterized protein G2W53_001522 [Senna tora]|uniref:Uncharacterized protein n=1 Tax=Senna tora TaxID=362788 RepID=A0A834XGG0_9FABA|nr:uncharacterized protein G2W53_001522 [Senna tora]